jgi:hypothetical protein
MRSEVRVSQTSTIPPVLVGKEKKSLTPSGTLWNKAPRRMGKKTGQKKVGKTLGQTKDQTPLLPLSGTRKVLRTPTNPFEEADTVEVYNRFQNLGSVCRYA